MVSSLEPKNTHPEWPQWRRQNVTTYFFVFTSSEFKFLPWQMRPPFLFSITSKCLGIYLLCTLKLSFFFLSKCGLEPLFTRKDYSTHQAGCWINSLGDAFAGLGSVWWLAEGIIRCESQPWRSVRFDIEYWAVHNTPNDWRRLTIQPNSASSIFGMHCKVLTNAHCILGWLHGYDKQ